uniref:Beta spectrin homolog n=1 Tax=Mus musculus TaxID=10090 RepID=Q9Z2V0_MOUSE|nr:beta spectrin homolog [Mus musculus]
MELQRTSSISGPLSPAYTGQVPYNYNQLEGRFKQLQDEREAVQKKTFTKWVNSHLARVSCRITDLYTDLRDGRMLIKLLEVLSGERLPKPTKGRMRIHCLENVDKALQFLKEQRVHLENMGSHDIVDGNHRLTTLELLEVRRQQEEEERKRRPPSPDPNTKVSEEAESQQWDTSKGDQVSQNGLPAEQGSPRVSYRSQTYQNYKNFNSRRTASDHSWSGM